MNILVIGHIIKIPLGGMVWHYLQYVIGLKRMGHEILFLEDCGDFPACYNPDNFTVSENPAYGLRFIQQIFDAYDLKGQWAYYDGHSGNWYGNSRQKVLSFCAKADLVLNVSGGTPLREWWIKIPSRVFVDTDPGFTQVKHLTDPSAYEIALQHTCYFSFAENINKAICTIPSDGFLWQPTRQPCVLDAWVIGPPLPSAKWTTIMQWDSYKVREYKGKMFGMKSLSFQEYESLPQLIQGEKFEIALGSATAPVDRLKGNGWGIINPLTPTKTPWSYQKYIQGSKGEWSIAKHGYVVSNSGWFSERSLCYMASAKPVLLQDTGFSEVIETGKGLLTFKSLDEVVTSLESLNMDYRSHCKWARCLVEENFEACKVLTALLREVL